MPRVASARERAAWETAVPIAGATLLVLYALPVAWLFLARSPASVLASLNEPFVVGAARNTLVSATASTALALLFGLPLAYWLARTDVRGQTLVTAVVAFPLVLPPVVSGMVLLSAFGSDGLGGLVGISVDGTLFGVVLAQTFVASPFVVLSARSAFERVDRHLEEVAWTQGVSRWRTLRRVTLPLARRGILAGATLAFARAAGEFGATLMLAYYPRTLPVQIWATFQGRGLDAAVPVAVVLVVVASAALVVLNTLGRSSPVGVRE
ncbi:molybdate ABC transporter permease subunit [Halosimplex salinum]|uniref:molybdate ABC transporter permease subunit n=1 Tax=Halosimplex salinum TaxID=1710538 RepID=UPI000F48D18B